MKNGPDEKQGRAAARKGTAGLCAFMLLLFAVPLALAHAGGVLDMLYPIETAELATPQGDTLIIGIDHLRGYYWLESKEDFEADMPKNWQPLSQPESRGRGYAEELARTLRFEKEAYGCRIYMLGSCAFVIYGEDSPVTANSGGAEKQVRFYPDWDMKDGRLVCWYPYLVTRNGEGGFHLARIGTPYKHYQPGETEQAFAQKSV